MIWWAGRHINIKERYMKAWLLTWVCNTAKTKEEVVAVLSSRKSEATISELVEFIVLRATSNVSGMMFYANRRKQLVYKAQASQLINGVPHRERILCGHDPWLYARKVTDFKACFDEKTNEEIISWREPDNFCWTQNKQGLEIAEYGIVKQLRRQQKELSSDFC